MKKGWHLFLVIAVIIAAGFFYIGCKVQKFYDQPTVDSKSKVDHWQPPELQKGMNKIIVNFGNVQNVYDVTNLLASGGTNFLFPSWLYGNSVTAHTSGFKVMILKNRVYIDVGIATENKPIQIIGGEIEDMPPTYDWNTNENNLEIVDETVTPIFQEIYQYPCEIEIRGGIRSGQILFWPDRYNQHQIQTGTFATGAGSTPIDLGLTQIFAYPPSGEKGILFNQ